MSASGSKPKAPPGKGFRRLRFTRREVLKMAQVGGVAATAGGLALFGRPAQAERSTKGICRICTMHCGVIGKVVGDRLVRVEGDPDSATDSFICHHGQALREIVHSEQRVRMPLKREGRSFHEIPWEQALREIAERMHAIERRHGARAVALQTGWPFVRHPIVWILHRFARAFGTPNVATVASLCEAVGRMGKALTVGSNLKADLQGTRTLVVWGSNPTFSYPPFAHVVAAMSLGRRNLIVIDPHRTELAQMADMHLAPRPGTDGALALGLLHVVIRDSLYDAELVAQHAVGFEELKALVAEYPPARVASICGVEAGAVLRVANLFAKSGPSAIWDGLGIEHHDNGLQTVRAVACLEAICGHVGQPGGAVMFDHAGPRFDDEPLPALYRMHTPRPLPAVVDDKPIGYDRYPLFEIFNRQAQANLFAEAILKDEPYALRGLILIGANPLVTSPGARRLRRAYGKLELLVTVDPFLTESGEASHYVLPAATFAEAAGVGTDEKVMPAPLVAPQHQAWPDWKILFELARACGLGRYFPWPTLKEALEAPAAPYMLDPAHQPRPNRPVAERGTPPRFPTMSGKIELRSELLARFGLDPLPRYVPPSATPTPDFPIVLVSGPRTRMYINSQFRNIPSISSKQPRPIVEVPPQIAGPAGIRTGDRVAVISPRGRIELDAKVSDSVHPETVLLGGGWSSANANLLTDGDALDPVSGFPAFRSTICRIEKIARR